MSKNSTSLSDRQKRNWGDITRRDFVGGTLLGTGAALLSANAPGLLSGVARAQTPGLTMTDIGDDWTGPGGIGDYAGKNGNTAEVVRAAHGAIRNHSYDQAIAGASDTNEEYDLIIVGCGIAGLTAAYITRRDKPDAKILMLDQHAIFGGEAKQNEFEVDGYRLTGPQGSTGIVVPYDRAKAANFISPLTDEIGLPQQYEFQKVQGLKKDILVPEDAYSPMHVAWERSDTGFYYPGHGWSKNPWRTGFKDTPLTESQRNALMKLELYRNPPKRDDWMQWLDSITYKQFIEQEVGITGTDLDVVTDYLNPQMAAMGCGLGADAVSALSAFNFTQPGVNGYWRYLDGGSDPTDDIYLASFPGGNAIIARKLLKKTMPDVFEGEDNVVDVYRSRVNWAALDKPRADVRMRLSSTVIGIQHDGDLSRAKSATVTYVKGGKVFRTKAKAVIAAGQQHANRHICRDMPEDVNWAMKQFHHAPMLVANVAVRNWKFLEKLGVASARWFDGFGWWASLRRNLVLGGEETQPLDPSKPFVFTLYNSFCLPGMPHDEQCTAARMSLFAMSYSDIEMQIRDQFTEMFGDYGFNADRDIAGIITNRQGHAYLVDPPGFFFGKDGKPSPLEVLKKRYGRVAFAHAELSGAQMWETAAAEGERAANQILEIL
ncbi:NAD(P)-binding protein [Emcibacter sp.]|uniref:NAD(P)-binding protein n=1 Tax=Emcibacter sp. TaxID=1979954 RepID=UPI002AA8AD5D|nr:NAD(P)-binding protein [Emcibacter sp.]